MPPPLPGLPQRKHWPRSWSRNCQILRLQAPCLLPNFQAWRSAWQASHRSRLPLPSWCQPRRAGGHRRSTPPRRQSPPGSRRPGEHRHHASLLEGRLPSAKPRRRNLPKGHPPKNRRPNEHMHGADLVCQRWLRTSAPEVQGMCTLPKLSGIPETAGVPTTELRGITCVCAETLTVLPPSQPTSTCCTAAGACPSWGAG